MLSYTIFMQLSDRRFGRIESGESGGFGCGRESAGSRRQSKRGTGHHSGIQAFRSCPMHTCVRSTRPIRAVEIAPPAFAGAGLRGLLAMTCGGGGIGNLGILRWERGNCAEQSQFAAGGFGGKMSCEKELGEEDAILPR
jgi:hypothetical protein